MCRAFSLLVVGRRGRRGETWKDCKRLFHGPSDKGKGCSIDLSSVPGKTGTGTCSRAQRSVPTNLNQISSSAQTWVSSSPPQRHKCQLSLPPLLGPFLLLGWFPSSFRKKTAALQALLLNRPVLHHWAWYKSVSTGQ